MQAILLLLLLNMNMTHALSPLPQGSGDCGTDEFWNFTMGMCSPLARAEAGAPMSMVMVHANGFLAGIKTGGPRGNDKLAAPHFVMVDAGQTAGDHHYLNVDLMLTAEKWTYPESGYPELLQVGEGYLDAQHPHSSPVMGLTFSDTIAFGPNKNYLQLFFAPRGQSTDGPIAFMHRPSAMTNPDAPLGHHVGQDVGHISSTVLGAALHTGSHTFEASTFKGLEPDPDKVDLPMARPDSLALRWTAEWNERTSTMLSWAYVKNPEREDPLVDHVFRTSASVYNRWPLQGHQQHQQQHQQQQQQQQQLLHGLIYGLIHNYDNAPALSSFTDEVIWEHAHWALWSRLEVLQRTAQELAIAENDWPRWVTAATVGFTHELVRVHDWNLSAGLSVTEDWIPQAFEQAYGSDHPWSGKVFLQVSGMSMWM
jgi:hypothetical protein